MPGCDPESAAGIAEAMRQAVEVECAPRVAGASGLTISISVGVAALEDGDISLAHLLERADQALSAAKSAGRNRVAKAAAEDSSAAQATAG
jgi:diguanylate cyclase (GGDEF)-like protein